MACTTPKPMKRIMPTPGGRTGSSIVPVAAAAWERSFPLEKSDAEADEEDHAGDQLDGRWQHLLGGRFGLGFDGVRLAGTHGVRFGCE